MLTVSEELVLSHLHLLDVRQIDIAVLCQRATTETNKNNRDTCDPQMTASKCILRMLDRVAITRLTRSPLLRFREYVDSMKSIVDVKSSTKKPPSVEHYDVYIDAGRSRYPSTRRSDVAGRPRAWTEMES
jgi:hypothetical protein